MGNRSSKSKPQTSNSSPPPKPKPNSAPSPPSEAEESTDLSSYQSACEEDPDLQAFDSALQARTTKAINAVADAVAIDHNALSLDSIEEVTLCFLEMNEKVVSLILDSKSDIWKDPDLFDLVKEYLENSKHTMNFCTALEDALQKAHHSQAILKFALLKFEEESTRGDELGPIYAKTLEELKKFKNAGDPFTENFFTLFQSVYRQQELMLSKLKEKKRKLDKKLRKVKSWSRISNAIFAVVVASVLICSVVAAAISAPPVVTALAAAASLPLGSVGKWITKMWKKYEDELKTEREMLITMEAGSFVVIQDLKSIELLVDKLENEIEGLMNSADFALERSEGVVKAMDDIKKNVVSFMETIQMLSDHAAQCNRDIGMARAVILKKINAHDSSSSDSGTCFD